MSLLLSIVCRQSPDSTLVLSILCAKSHRLTRIQQALAIDSAGKSNPRHDPSFDRVDLALQRIAASLQHRLKSLRDGRVEPSHCLILHLGHACPLPTSNLKCGKSTTEAK